MERYNNTCLSISAIGTPDPFVVATHGKYKLTFTARTHVEIWSVESLIDIDKHATKNIVWTPPEDTNFSSLIWAPELHLLQGRWYIYVACAHTKRGNQSHRMYVLGGPDGEVDPSDGPWENLGQIQAPDGGPYAPHQWAIDGTVVTLNNEMYFIYSGWPRPNPTKDPHTQKLFIFKLETPTKAATFPPQLLCQPDEDFEFSGEWGINEGPQYLESPDGSWKGIAYSCSGCWTPDYKMNTIQYLGGDPLDRKSWKKSKDPLLRIDKSSDRPPYGPGHGGWLNLGGEMVGIFHATDHPEDTGPKRKARLQRVIWTEDGPYMGTYVGQLAKTLSEFTEGSDVHGGLKGLFHAPK